MQIPISLFTVENRKVETTALINCGAKGASFIDKDFVEQENISLQELPTPVTIANVDRSENQGGTMTHYAKVTVEVKGRATKVVLLVTSLGYETVILGYLWLRKENPDIDWRKQTLT